MTGPLIGVGTFVVTLLGWYLLGRPARAARADGAADLATPALDTGSLQALGRIEPLSVERVLRGRETDFFPLSASTLADCSILIADGPSGMLYAYGVNEDRPREVVGFPGLARTWLRLAARPVGDRIAAYASGGNQNPWWGYLNTKTWRYDSLPLWPMLGGRAYAGPFAPRGAQIAMMPGADQAQPVKLSGASLPRVVLMDPMGATRAQDVAALQAPGTYGDWMDRAGFLGWHADTLVVVRTTSAHLERYVADTVDGALRLVDQQALPRYFRAMAPHEEQLEDARTGKQWTSPIRQPHLGWAQVDPDGIVVVVRVRDVRYAGAAYRSGWEPLTIIEAYTDAGRRLGTFDVADGAVQWVTRDMRGRLLLGMVNAKGVASVIVARDPFAPQRECQGQ